MKCLELVAWSLYALFHVCPLKKKKTPCFWSHLIYRLKVLSILSFPNNKFLDFSKLKAFADDSFKVDGNDRKFSKRVANTVGKGERFVLQTLKNQGLLWKGLKVHKSRTEPMNIWPANL